MNTLLSTLVQLLHNILKCNYFEMTTVSFLAKIISIPDEELFSETYVGCTASYFVKIIWYSRWFCIPPLLRQCIVIFAVAEGWLLLDIGWFVLFLSCFRAFEFRTSLGAFILLRLKYNVSTFAVVSQKVLWISLGKSLQGNVVAD